MSTELILLFVTIGFGILYLVFKKFVTKRTKIINKIREWINTIFSSLVFALLIISFIIQAYAVKSGSMMNTLLEKDRLFVLKFIYGIREPFKNTILIPIVKPKRGDIVVFKYPENPRVDFVKRCMGIPGDKIYIENKVIYINDKKLDESYAIHLYGDRVIRRDFGPIVIPEGKYFMLGDNRDNSKDSRVWGLLDKKYVKGRVLFRYWPLFRIRFF